MVIRKQFLFLFLLLLAEVFYAQDFDIYPRTKDDNFNMPDLYEQTSFDDYQILSRNMRMMDMAYAAIVPGYIHFKAKEPITGYSVMAARLIGYTGLAVNFVRINNSDNIISDIPNLGDEYKMDEIIFLSSISIIASSYLFDWIHGKYRLEKKQEMLRYKYGIKLKMNKMAYNSQNYTPMFLLTYNF